VPPEDSEVEAAIGEIEQALALGEG